MDLEEIIAAAAEDPGTLNPSNALVVLSGGQDSVTCLLWALRVFSGGVEAVTFDYGQKHAIEISVAKMVCRELGVRHHVIDQSHIGQVSGSALIKAQGGDVRNQHSLNPQLPASFVPNRNAMLLTTAHALAQTIGIKNLVAGMCQTDYSGYPDCRADFVQALNTALDMGGAKPVAIHTPLMYLTKADTFELADRLGFLDFVLENSHTCYNGDRTVRSSWGYGCGDCPACTLRRKGWEEFQARTSSV